MRLNRIGAAVAELAAEVLRPAFAHVVATLHVHDWREVLDGTRCPCCQDPDCEIVESRVMVDIIIDVDGGERIYEADVSPEEWAEKLELSDRFDVQLRCSVHTLDLFLDTSRRHLCLAGAHRAAKTTTSLYLFAADLLRYGGLNKRAWLVAPTEEDAHKLLQKLLRPTPVGKSGHAPAIIPPGLVLRTPATARTSDMITTLIDGTIVDLRSFNGDPGASRLKSDPCFAILCDEAAHLPSGDSLSALVGRTFDAGGRLMLASTPRPSAVMTSIVVEPAMEFERMDPADPRKAAGDHPGAQWIFRSLPLIHNVFLNREDTLRKMRGVDMTRPEARRDFLGEWVASEGRCWVNFLPDTHVVRHEARTVGDMSPAALAEYNAGGHVDITPRVAKSLFGKTNPHVRAARATNFRYVLGQDVNRSPMSTVLIQVTAPADKLDDRDSWSYWILDNVVTPSSNSLAHAERLVGMQVARAVDPNGHGSPFTGCGVICDSTAISRDPTAHIHGQSGSAAETFWRVGLDCRAPAYRYPSSPGKPGNYNPAIVDRWTLIHRLINERRLHVFWRAGSLLTAFEQQLVMPDGIVPMDGRSGRWDTLMSAPDAMSYGIYAIATMRKPGAAMSLGELPRA